MNTRVRFVQRPEGGSYVPHKSFRIEQGDLPRPPAQGQLSIEIEYLSLDPTLRVQLDDVRSYTPPIGVGELMKGVSLARVAAVGPGVDGYAVGDLVIGQFLWEECQLVDSKNARRLDVPPGVDHSSLLSALGPTGQTAYWGCEDILHPQKGETLVVSGAAGAVGSIVCQLGRIYGCRVVGIAGSDEKCDYLRKIGVDIALNYKSDSFKQHFIEATPQYVDKYFDNVGGSILDLVLSRLNKNARIAMCGSISSYDGAGPTPIHNYASICAQRATLQGFLVLDYLHRAREAIGPLSKYLAQGSLVDRVTIVEGGLKQAPDALRGLLDGKNVGKMLVRVQSNKKAKA